MVSTNEVIEWTKRLTNLIKQITNDPSPDGLHKAINLIKDQIPKDLERDLRFVATIRNKLAHESNFREADIPNNFVMQANDAWRGLLNHYNLNSKIMLNPLEESKWYKEEIYRYYFFCVVVGTVTGLSSISICQKIWGIYDALIPILIVYGSIITIGFIVAKMEFIYHILARYKLYRGIAWLSEKICRWIIRFMR